MDLRDLPQAASAATVAGHPRDRKRNLIWAFKLHAQLRRTQSPKTHQFLTFSTQEVAGLQSQIRYSPQSAEGV